MADNGGRVKFATPDTVVPAEVLVVEAWSVVFLAGPGGSTKGGSAYGLGSGNTPSAALADAQRPLTSQHLTNTHTTCGIEIRNIIFLQIIERQK